MQSQATDRDLMAPETEPTDAELHLVMREALALAMERKKMSDVMMRQRLLDEVAQVWTRHQTLK